MQLSDYFRHLNYTEIPVSSNLWIIVYTRDIRLYIIKVTPFITMKALKEILVGIVLYVAFILIVIYAIIDIFILAPLTTNPFKK